MLLVHIRPACSRNASLHLLLLPSLHLWLAYRHLLPYSVAACASQAFLLVGYSVAAFASQAQNFLQRKLWPFRYKEEGISYSYLYWYDGL